MDKKSKKLLGLEFTDFRDMKETVMQIRTATIDDLTAITKVLVNQYMVTLLGIK